MNLKISSVNSSYEHLFYVLQNAVILPVVEGGIFIISAEFLKKQGRNKIRSKSRVFRGFAQITIFILFIFVV